MIGELAHRALLLELRCFPKPGLVSHIDSGSHQDMDAACFEASAAAIRPFLSALACAGHEGADMPALRVIGMAAERAMMAATGGVNTHRGAIFGLGLLCAAAGVATERGPAHLGDVVAARWGDAIRGGPVPPRSHGTTALRRYGIGGAREQAAKGFPLLYAHGLPAWREGCRLGGGDDEAARLHCFFALMAVLPDTTLLHRGGMEGLLFAQGQARRFLDAGGVGRPGWRQDARAMHRLFVERSLSGGGCADMLAMTLFVAMVEDLPRGAASIAATDMMIDTVGSGG
ncbi:triphosphoribosyl-dephospho-CoA synthase MdcB [Rhizosaccharibacter radicis]|uniref:Probable 2-(5''-triphosphoribosyl)-3'-dephosphocoenzyme-A synthase n=1 Tax=Rhizosaccharibacter radicis TaxID=2782605 RepID=A0ABT1W3K5_9PROT|nr:triphosphoribosyl-dephospho-CoA synthase MdcB [Acetobacteraceae bacterium KSS12]